MFCKVFKQFPTLGTPSVAAISFVSSLIVLNTHLKKLHLAMKYLINILLVHNLIASLVIISLLIYVTLSRDHSTLICFLMYESYVLPMILTLTTISFLSIMRYFIATKTANIEFANIKMMVGLSVLAYLFEYIIVTLIAYLAIMYNWAFFIPACEGQNIKGQPIVAGLNFLICTVCLIFGMFCDGLLIKFIRKRMNSVGPGQAKLVPWKSSNKGDEMNVSVPLSATLASLGK